MVIRSLSEIGILWRKTLKMYECMFHVIPSAIVTPTIKHIEVSFLFI
jgi:hypothetical protein